ncbi:hypothetical protein ABZT03_31280 [Streptomyces sp. NPDC005574]|uniref:hypothetical protein n=1 Tax=Streptomyces sp. NPDC005574 TaxID=3156891 RepID=UPI0033B9602D
MAAVVLVHGIWNRQRGLSATAAAAELAAEGRKRLRYGLVGAGLGHIPLPTVAMAYYADLLADEQPQEPQSGDGGLEDLTPDQLAEAWQWLVAAGVPQEPEAQAGWLAPVRQGLGWLVRHRSAPSLTARAQRQLTERLGRLVVAVLQDTDAYLSRPQRRQAVRDVVARAVSDTRPQVLVAHSLGTVVAYEALHAYPELRLDLFVTVGSPLGLPALLRKLEPEPCGLRGTRPPGVAHWINIADAGDLVAVPPELGGAFPVNAHASTEIGLFDLHTLGGYLANGVTAAAIAPYLV